MRLLSRVGTRAPHETTQPFWYFPPREGGVRMSRNADGEVTNAIPELNPVRKMRAHEPCWCRSGKKWKNCHKHRQNQVSLQIYDLLKRQTSAFQKGDCSTSSH